MKKCQGFKIGFNGQWMEINSNLIQLSRVLELECAKSYSRVSLAQLWMYNQRKVQTYISGAKRHVYYKRNQDHFVMSLSKGI
ncbi:hypothetical protein Y1Q_0009692 [Alligator mississippiensis]|uniref:Uncharacterized protein n=1 Tax=Alligator mississippiensis TaxID=8496 RepID=A0A151MW98_ALLMI|nr:hypothetical protein Y1Q_0009692 [Alligator mississippiensis]